MEKILSLPLLCLLVTLAAGCATGHHSKEANARLKELVPGKAAVTIPKKDSVLKRNGKMAVYLGMESMELAGRVGPAGDWQWDARDIKLVETYLKTLENDGFISEYVFLSHEKGKNMPVEKALEKARAVNADSLLVIQSIIEVDRHFNPAAILDLTIICAFLVPGSEVDAYAVSRSALLDIGTGKNLFLLKHETMQRKAGPTLMLKNKDAVIPAKKLLLRKALREIYRYARFNVRLE